MSIIVSLHDHPAFHRRWLARQSRRVAADCREASHTLSEMRSALVDFGNRLEEYQQVIAPTRRESRATIAALDSGDIATMEAVRDGILRRRGSR
ncbi:hypothetical protein [Caenispirillum bisanense]|uniref:hypothetical protein n=1 Tax=Caenispirillum bisanense TaxID=414052 RepID=UPI0031DF75A7